jgi:hypothetical protein
MLRVPIEGLADVSDEIFDEDIKRMFLSSIGPVVLGDLHLPRDITP